MGEQLRHGERRHEHSMRMPRRGSSGALHRSPLLASQPGLCSARVDHLTRETRLHAAPRFRSMPACLPAPAASPAPATNTHRATQPARPPPSVIQAAPSPLTRSLLLRCSLPPAPCHQEPAVPPTKLPVEPVAAADASIVVEPAPPRPTRPAQPRPAQPLPARPTQPRPSPPLRSRPPACAAPSPPPAAAQSPGSPRPCCCAAPPARTCAARAAWRSTGRAEARREAYASAPGRQGARAHTKVARRPGRLAGCSAGTF